MKLPTNMGELVEQVQKLQRNMESVQKEAEKKEVEVTTGGGMVTVRVNGKQEIISLKIDKTVVDPADVGMLEDLVRAAVNEGVRKSKELMKEEISSITGGFPIPGFS